MTKTCANIYEICVHAQIVEHFVISLIFCSHPIYPRPMHKPGDLRHDADLPDSHDKGWNVQKQYKVDYGHINTFCLDVVLCMKSYLHVCKMAQL